MMLKANMDGFGAVIRGRQLTGGKPAFAFIDNMSCCRKITTKFSILLKCPKSLDNEPTSSKWNPAFISSVLTPAPGEKKKEKKRSVIELFSLQRGRKQLYRVSIPPPPPINSTSIHVNHKLFLCNLGNDNTWNYFLPRGTFFFPREQKFN